MNFSVYSVYSVVNSIRLYPSLHHNQTVNYSDTLLG